MAKLKFDANSAIVKPLSLKESFKLASTYALNRSVLPRVLSEVFSLRSMEKYGGERRVVPPLLQKILGWPNIIVLTDPDKIKILLRNQQQLRPPLIRKLVEMVPKKPNIFTIDDKDIWAKYRQIMTPYLKVNSIVEESPEVKRIIKELEDQGNIPDVADFCAIYSARVFSKNMLGYDITDNEAISLAHAYSNFLQPNILSNIVSGYLLKPFFAGLKKQFSEKSKKIEKYSAVFEGIADNVIAHALNNPKDESYVTKLIALVKNQFNDDEKIFEDKDSEPYKAVKSQIMIMLAGGIEAPRAQLFWALNYIAHNPDVQNALIQEAQQYGEIQNYKETLAFRVLKEAVRLKSPVYGMMKASPFVDNKDLYFIPLPALHNDSHRWGEDVHEFKPDRHIELKPDSHFLAFGGGPHGCPGEQKAYQQAVTLILGMYNAGIKLTPRESVFPMATVSFLVQPPRQTSLDISR